MGYELPTRQGIFGFLNELRESGKVNMFESPRFIVDRFDVSPEEAKTYFFEWTQSLDRSNPS